MAIALQGIRRALRVVALVLGIGCSAAALAQQPPAFPIKRSNVSDRYLVDQNERPFFWAGDTAWSLFAQLSREDASLYLSDRRAKGFSVVLASLIEHKFSSNRPANHYGDAPFVGAAFSSAPNEAYFRHADYVINAAAERGLLVLLDPLYLGYGCEDEGWCKEVRAASVADMRAWGRYVGNRYKNYPNIVWLIGGDTDPRQVEDKVRAVVEGIREFDTVHLMTAHNEPESFAIEPWQGESWLTVNNVYTYEKKMYERFREAYSAIPAMPFFQIESTYENQDGVTVERLRTQAYWALLSGGMGAVFGNCPMWHFGSTESWCGLADWKSQLSRPGSTSMRHLHALFRSRPWHLLVPDLQGTIVVGGASSDTTSFAPAARTASGQTIIAYLPTRRTVRIAMNRIAGTDAVAWWFNPSTGVATHIGTFATTEQRSFTPPTSSKDWVLVLDDAAANLPAPGTAQDPVSSPPTVTRQPSASLNSTATAASVAVLGNDDGGERALSYIWSAASSSGGVATFSPNGINAAKDAVATFTKAGAYALSVAVVDAEGQSVTAGINVVVDAQPGAISVTPSSATVAPGASRQFSATMRDQFGSPLSDQPSFAWSTTGGGTISASGLFTAGAVGGGPFNVVASSAGVQSAPASVTVSTAPQTPIYIGGSVGSAELDEQWNYLNVFRFVAPADMSINQMEVYVTQGTGGSIKMAVYSDAQGVPGTLQRTSSQITSNVLGWNAAPLNAPLTLSRGEACWLAFNTNHPGLKFSYSHTGGVTRWKSMPYDSDWPVEADSTAGPLSESWAIRAY